MPQTPRSVNCNINLPQASEGKFVLKPDTLRDGTPNVDPPVLFAGTVAEPNRLRFMLEADDPTGGGTLIVIAPGMSEWSGRALMDGEGPSIDLVPGNNSFRKRPAPQPRSPLVLPRCTSCPSPFSYDQDLSKMWPSGVPQDRDYLRANCWGIPIPGLPWVPGITSSKHPERFLSYIFASYPRWAQDEWLLQNQLRGYRTGVHSWPNARVQAGQTLAQFAADCSRIKSALGYVHVKLWSKDFDPHNMTLAEWQAFALPIFAALDGIADEYSPWEYDSFNTAGQIALDVHKWLGQQAHAQGASFWCHFYPHVPFWDDRGDAFWWNALGRNVDGLDYQGDPSWDIGDLQARSVDILNLFATTGHKLRQFEPGTPTLMFDGDHPTEDEADAFGYLSTCTMARSKPWGFGAGARLLDGSVI